MLLHNKGLGWNVCFFLICLSALAWITGGCSIGPQIMPRERVKYGHAMAQSSREELLLNIVRLRYLELPHFLSVNSMVNQYSLESEVSAGATRQALDPRFKQIVDLMDRMQRDETMCIRVESTPDEKKPSFAFIISNAHDEEERGRIAELKALLGLNPDTDHYRIVFSSLQKDNMEIALVTRSVLSILGLILMMAESTEAVQAPLLTIPAG